MRLFLREHERADVYAREVRTARNNAYIVATPSRTVYRSRRHFYMLMNAASHSLRRSGFYPTNASVCGDPFIRICGFFIGKHKRKNSLRASNQSETIAKPEKLAFYAYVTYTRLFLREHERDTRDFAQESVLRTVDWLQNQLVLWAFMPAKCERQEITLILSPRRRGLRIVRGGILYA